MKQQRKYYSLIEEYHDYCLKLKTNKLTNLFKQNKIVIEENEENLEKSIDEGKKNNKRANKKKEKFQPPPKKSNASKRK
jgi:hypothetical protein